VKPHRGEEKNQEAIDKEIERGGNRYKIVIITFLIIN